MAINFLAKKMLFLIFIGTAAMSFAQQRGTPTSLSEEIDLSGVPAGLEFSIIDDKTVSITNYTGEERNFTVPDIIVDLPVTVIAKWAFADNWDLQTIIIPSSVKLIGDNAFAFCESLRRITLSRHTQLGRNAIPNGVRIVYRD